MLIPQDTIIRHLQHKPKVTGVIHVGAHRAEEANFYSKILPRMPDEPYGQLIWIDADDRSIDWINNNRPATDIVIHGAVHSYTGQCDFHEASNGASSSVLPPGTHLQHHPHITFKDPVKINCIRLDELLNGYNLKQYNFLNLDIQGIELQALKGYGKNLKYLDYIYTEVNTEDVYKDCDKLFHLDDYLIDFRRVDIHLTSHGWGDAFYVRRKDTGDSKQEGI